MGFDSESRPKSHWVLWQELEPRSPPKSTTNGHLIEVLIENALVALGLHKASHMIDDRSLVVNQFVESTAASAAAHARHEAGQVDRATDLAELDGFALKRAEQLVNQALHYTCVDPRIQVFGYVAAVKGVPSDLRPLVSVAIMDLRISIDVRAVELAHEAA